MNNKIINLLLISRVFSSPMTIMSWLVIFIYSYINGGNVLNGVIALFGICLAHFGTNTLDDYFDYKHLIKQVGFDKKSYLENSQKTKCRYIISGEMSENKLLCLSGIYLLIALIIGVLLFIKCGIGVLWYTLVASVGILLYPFASRICLAEVVTALIYGPILFGGVYYVMCSSYSKETYILSIPTMLVTIILLYIHTVMDYTYDVGEGKKTLANRFKTQLDSLIILKGLLILAYVSVIFLCIFDISDWQVFITLLTIPLAIDLYKSMKDFTIMPNSIPEHKWYHFPMENMKNFKTQGEDSFMIRIYQARNLMIYFSILLTIGIILSGLY